MQAFGGDEIPNLVARPERPGEEQSSFFEGLTGHPPFSYQIKIAGLILEGRNVVLSVPTGAGKTWAVLVPFLFPGWKDHPARLIYALPLRTLAQGVYRQAKETAKSLGYPVESGSLGGPWGSDHGKWLK